MVIYTVFRYPANYSSELERVLVDMFFSYIQADEKATDLNIDPDNKNYRFCVEERRLD